LKSIFHDGGESTGTLIKKEVYTFTGNSNPDLEKQKKKRIPSKPTP
jgi:hypothetical protein